MTTRSLFYVIVTLLIYPLTCSVHSPAQPVPIAARLAVLELQGDVGTLKERQRWIDHARSVALERMKGSDVRVLDREDFEALLPPDASLASCVGQCSAQVARSIGAHWALSATLQLQGSTIHVTLKLHSADGKLLSVKQGQLSRLEGEDQLRATIATLTYEALEPIAPLQPPNFLTHHPEHEPEAEPGSGPRAELEPTRAPKGDLALRAPSPKPIGPLKWWRSPEERSARCLSERVRWVDYLRCVDAGACSEPPVREGCERVADEPVRCVDLSQALSYVVWLQRQSPHLTHRSPRMLPTISELRALKSANAGLFSSSDVVRMEWVVTSSSPTSPLPPRALKVAPKELTARLNHRGELSTRPTPPAFQLPQLGFRLSVRSRRGGCPTLP